MTPGWRSSVVSARSRASPVAVPPLEASWASAVRTATRSLVGGCRMRGAWLKAMTPRRTPRGTPRVKVTAAARAAASREGRTSVACIEPETSVTSMIVAFSTGTAIVVRGRAAATTRIASTSA